MFQIEYTIDLEKDDVLIGLGLILDEDKLHKPGSLCWPVYVCGHTLFAAVNFVKINKKKLKRYFEIKPF